jgi:hypothetical protein
MSQRSKSEQVGSIHKDEGCACRSVFVSEDGHCKDPKVNR